MALTYNELMALDTLVKIIFLKPDNKLINDGTRLLRMMIENSIQQHYTEKIDNLTFYPLTIVGTNVINACLQILISDTCMWYFAFNNDKVFSYISNN